MNKDDNKREKYLDEKVFDFLEKEVAPVFKPVTSFYDKITRPFLYRHESLIHRAFLPFAIIFFLYMASFSIKFWIAYFSNR
ncbi:hypothetical protein [Anaerovibrio sp.]|uniref:hypothetical protein n=1 Tax=Anaerovibrio sp. TaxID=1872532 RepID=UPI00388E1DA7